MQTIVVFSHLRWQFVYQRPQHLLSRLAAHWRVVFIEEPVTRSPETRIERLAPADGVEVWRPHVPGEAPGFHDDHLPVMQQLISEAMREREVEDYWVWLYTPMALPLASGLSPRGVVYDCMDELTAFKQAPRQLVQRENALFKLADLVFTGGPSLYESKRNRHPDVHCFSSSVDASHFTRRTDDHPLQAGLPNPRLGWCGVIDERVDLQLIADMAAARPHWQIVMVGPVVKIDPASLPRLPNIHWLGQQGYAELPAFISGWDVCLMPFAINDATRFISPTKMLEYMACGRPSVSTPIKDVVEPYGHLVSIAGNSADFIAACDAILARTPAEHEEHARALAQAISLTSWDLTAGRMAELIARADENRQAVPLVPAHPEAVAAVRETLARPAWSGADSLTGEQAATQRPKQAIAG
jgi:glycosyltransferase involved in cell wall biosynthesis